MAMSNAERQAAWRERRENELAWLRERVRETETQELRNERTWKDVEDIVLYVIGAIMRKHNLTAEDVADAVADLNERPGKERAEWRVGGAEALCRYWPQ